MQGFQLHPRIDDEFASYGCRGFLFHLRGIGWWLSVWSSFLQGQQSSIALRRMIYLGMTVEVHTDDSEAEF